VNKTLIITVLAVGVTIFGIWYFDLVHAAPKAMTIEQCGTALRASTEFGKLVDNMDERNRSAAYETGAMRCVLDHDPETASWSDEKKLAIVGRAFCDKHAGGVDLTKIFCEGLFDKESERSKKYGMESIIIPKTIR
jgi:hypothetical protein